ncbi:alpha/beta fold hydrolase [Cryobacterium algoricola]|uniref:Alpha/beta fold hydrolase n=1 Tax=Cryobacterium algoricola TaxID=1259183 RepID=A0ABY2IHE7_9MICO|nr:alpha/beta fold hydrolase [Cryobacterium algoricola]TFB87750.1 alpha/beta fold hydrolase [Cryobacterium algoricola]
MTHPRQQHQYRLPRAAATPAPAALPPEGLPGLDPAFSRLVEAEEPGAGIRTWHLLDNGPLLASRGIAPVGTILCVHGNPTWSYLWRSLVTQATDAATRGAEAWRVIAVDQLEMGFSERTGTVRPLARRVADLGDLTDALGLAGPVVTFGHDWGGVVSLGWAVDHPDLLAGVLLLNTAVHQPEDAAIPAPLRLALQGGVLGTATVTTPAFLDTTLALAHPPLSAAVKRAYRAPYRGAARRGGIGAFVADIPVGPGSVSTPELDRIASGIRRLGVPALLLWGPTDPIFSDRYLDDLLDRLTDADVHRFEGAGHLVAEDVDYAAAALTWLADRAPVAAVSAPVSAPVTAAVPAAVPVPVESDRSSGHSRPEKDISDAETAPGSGSGAGGDGYQPLWHYLDEFRESDDIALVDMAPGHGAAQLSVTWRELSTRVRRLATGLYQIGVRKGDRVSLLVPPGADLTAVLYACVRIGAVVVVADAGLGLRGLTRAVRGARPDHVIGATPGLLAARALGWPGQKIAAVTLARPLARLLDVSFTLAELESLGAEEELPQEPTAADTAAVLFTSGSTGPAKGVVYTNGQLAAVSRALRAQYGVGPGTGLVAGFAPFALLGPALGARSVTPDMDVTSPKTLTATAVAAAVAAIDASVVFLSPAALTNVVATAGSLSPADWASLAGVRSFLSAGAPVAEPLLAAAARLMPGATAHTPYGMTEGLLMTDITLEGIRAATGDRLRVPLPAATDAVNGIRNPGRPATSDVETTAAPGGVCVGCPTGTTRIRISALDDRGAATGELSEQTGVTGEIVVSAPHVEDHYDRLWLTDRAARRGAITGERWHRTGDVGHLDVDGRLWVEGRLPHVIVTSAGVVTPVGPEQAIERIRSTPRAAVTGDTRGRPAQGHAGVARAAVVGIGPVGTQQLVAVVETTPAARRVRLASSELAAAVRLASTAPIAAVLVVPHLPTDIRHNSKIDRSRLARWAGGILSGGRMTRP